MRNILEIIKHDAGRLTSSVVAIITIMGLCIIPCLYAWFNIFSNWAPYDSEATGRIRVAVANEDEGAELLGLNVNVGEKITESLKANDAIGWQFTDTADEAIERVRSGDCYAALVIPGDFSSNVMSFVSGDLQNPQLIYYENEKKNAIAPKITGKAKTAVREQVNATFVETLAKYASDAASVINSGGYDPRIVFSDLSDKLDLLGERLETCSVMLDSVKGLSDSARSLMSVSDLLLEDAETAAEGQEDLLESASEMLPEKSNIKESAEKKVNDQKETNKENLITIGNDIDDAMTSIEDFNAYVRNKLTPHRKLVDKMARAAANTEDFLRKLGFTAVADRFGELKTQLETVKTQMAELRKATKKNWEERKTQLSDLNSEIAAAKKLNDLISADNLEGLDRKLQGAIKDARSALSDARKTLNGMEDGLGDLGEILGGYDKSLGELEDSLDSTELSLEYMQSGLSTIAGIFDRIAGNGTLGEVNDLLTDDRNAIAEYLSSPVKMETEVIYPIEEYGSAMAPFYTVLAQWVGALLTAVLIKTRVRKHEDLPEPNLSERFFGRYGLYMFIGLAQALIVSLGDLLYVGIQCHHPLLFVFAACMNGITFMMINYALVFALENIGLGAGVIILVLQVAGSGGTYPVEVLPPVFRALYPAMPFRYAMDAMRECIGGMYDHTYAKCMGILLLFLIASALFGLIMHKPAQRLNRLIQEGKDKSEIML